jgi:hypothetical protein
VCERLIARERQALVLESRIETVLRAGDQKTAWQGALELDQLRQQLAEDRTEVARLEAAARTQQAGIVERERRLAAVQQKLYPS